MPARSRPGSRSVEHRLFAFLITDADHVVRPVHAMAMPVVLIETGLGHADGGALFSSATLIGKAPAVATTDAAMGPCRGAAVTILRQLGPVMLSFGGQILPLPRALNSAPEDRYGLGSVSQEIGRRGRTRRPLPPSSSGSGVRRAGATQGNKMLAGPFSMQCHLWGASRGHERKRPSFSSPDCRRHRYWPCCSRLDIGARTGADSVAYTGVATGPDNKVSSCQ